MAFHVRCLLSYFLLVSGILGFSNTEHKRLVLHSDEDMTQALHLLREEVGVLKQELQTVRLQLVSQETKSDGWSVYVRWGRTTCPGNGTELVYKGYMAGRHFQGSGGGVNFACMPHDVIWEKYTDGVNSAEGGLYGAEYELYGGHQYNFDAPCALCRVPRGSVLMIPGRSQCFPSWTEEYTGYLVAGQGGKSATDLACLDSNWEGIERSGTNDDQCVIHHVEARCGSLPCPPYVDGRELTCVVCSK